MPREDQGSWEGRGREEGGKNGSWSWVRKEEKRSQRGRPQGLMRLDLCEVYHQLMQTAEVLLIVGSNEVFDLLSGTSLLFLTTS